MQICCRKAQSLTPTTRTHIHEIQVLDFARTQGRTSGNAQKRVPFVAFAKAKPAVAVQRKGVRAVKRGGRGN